MTVTAAEQRYMQGATHGYRNYRFGIGFPRGAMSPDGQRLAPHTAFRDAEYGLGYCAGWKEASAARAEIKTKREGVPGLAAGAAAWPQRW